MLLLLAFADRRRCCYPCCCCPFEGVVTFDLVPLRGCCYLCSCRISDWFVTCGFVAPSHALDPSTSHHSASPLCVLYSLRLHICVRFPLARWSELAVTAMPFTDLVCFICGTSFQPPTPFERMRLLCTPCEIAFVADAFHAASEPRSLRRCYCLVCRSPMSRRAGALTCSVRCRMLLYRARCRLDVPAPSSLSVRYRVPPDAWIWKALDASEVHDCDALVPDFLHSPHSSRRPE